MGLPLRKVAVSAPDRGSFSQARSEFERRAASMRHLIRTVCIGERHVSGLTPMLRSAGQNPEIGPICPHGSADGLAIIIRCECA